MKKLKFGDAIEIVWTDACGHSQGWGPAYEKGIEVHNVGVFVTQNKYGLCLAKGVSFEDREQVLEPTFIPRGMLKKIRKLR